MVIPSDGKSNITVSHGIEFPEGSFELSVSRT